MRAATPSAPLLLEPVPVERVWGTTELAPWAPPPASGKPIGELWLTALECPVEGRSTTLGELFGAHFPVLLKLLFPREKLSVQVHPDDAAAQAAGQPCGKSECWYILSADPGATVAVGFRKPVSADAISAAIADGSLESHMRLLPVRAGDMVYVPAGCVHAIGPGMVVLETQQYSDTTFRLFDYGRPRELHIEQGLAVTKLQPPAGVQPGHVAPQPMVGFERLLSCPFFQVDRFTTSSTEPARLPESSYLQILVPLSPGMQLQTGAHSRALTPGHASVLPAAMAASSVTSAIPAQFIRVVVL